MGDGDGTFQYRNDGGIPKVGDIVVGFPGQPHSMEVAGVVVKTDPDSISVACFKTMRPTERAYGAIAISSWEYPQRAVAIIDFAVGDPRNFRKVQ